MPLFTFDRRVQQYRDATTGKFISQTTMTDLVKQTIEQTRSDLNTIANLLMDGKVSLQEWQRGTALALKQLHIQEYLLGRGGEKMMQDSDYAALTDRVQSEFGYLDQFAQDMQAGMSEGQFQARLQMYVNATTNTYQMARREGHTEQGYQFERRNLGDAEHCSPCEDYAGMGWQQIGTLPGIGEQCDCRANCLCAFEFSQDNPSDRALLSRGWGWLGKRDFARFGK